MRSDYINFEVMKTCISGSLAYDYIMKVKGAFDESIMADNLHNLSVGFLLEEKERHFGGTAGNIAYNLHLLGEKPQILASIGRDGDDYLKRINEWGGESENQAMRNAHAIIIDKEKDTAAAYIYTDEKGKQMTYFYPGAMSSGEEKIDLHGVIEKLCGNSDGKMAESSAKATPTGWGCESDGTGENTDVLLLIAPDDIGKIMEYVKQCKNCGISYIFDPGQNLPYYSKEQLNECIDGALGMILNDYEYEMFKKNSGLDEGDIMKKMEILIVTKGENGSDILVKKGSKLLGASGGACGAGIDDGLKGVEKVQDQGVASNVLKLTIPVFKPKTIAEPTGCGDAFRGGLLYGLGKGYSIEKAAKIGALCGTYAIECNGTQNHKFTKQDFEQRLGESLD